MSDPFLPIFAKGDAPERWQPSGLASGPFAGLQGGAVAGLLTGEIERAAVDAGWGMAISASIWFLRPAPMAKLRTRMTPVHVGGRLTVIDNSLWVDGTDQPCALARISLAKPRPIDIPGFVPPPAEPVDPASLPSIEPRAPHGGPWFMDAMEVRDGGVIRWFNLRHQLIERGGPMSRALGPADWSHGVNRPVDNIVADPNPNLTVHLLREPHGDWIGLEAQTHWQPGIGIGIGGGVLHDVQGVLGRVSMSVALTPFPRPTN